LAGGIRPEHVIFLSDPEALECGYFDNVSCECQNMALTNVPPITAKDRGAIAMPRFARVEAIKRSANDDSTNRELGRVDHRHLRVGSV
jgi:hypothetical protein